MNRRQFTSLLGAAAASRITALAAPSPQRFYFAVIADTHIIDEFYKGPEGNPLDTETIFKTGERLAAARDFINSLNPPMERVFLVGDYFHNYPSAEWDFYFQHKTRVDRALELTSAFKMPVHAGFGNHDYAVPRVSREFSHNLFQQKFGLKPYYSVDYKDFKFIHLNNFIGDTWNPKSAIYDKGQGSLGEEQLNWLEAELAQRKPTFVFIHFPLRICLDVEVKDYGLHPLLRKYSDSIQRVISGHWHKWYDFARTFGPPHWVMAATRYDEDAYMLIEVDRKAVTHRVLNLDEIGWSTHYSRPYHPA
ncbi:MAG: metallophosphoesterase [Acidobacteriia bacterium]|nr:metallophosphoesterase [Terriglobia bacterium]